VANIMTRESDRRELIPRLTDAIVANYRMADPIQHLGDCPLPKYEVVIEILDDFKDLFYPGFRRREGLHASNISYYVGSLIDSLIAKLAKQVTRALIHADRVNHSPTVVIKMEGQGRTSRCSHRPIGFFHRMRQSLPR
jgi:serine O-acetyltransferase